MKQMNNGRRHRGNGKIRYAVVGLGHIAQFAVLPAFLNARGNSALAALISDDPAKLGAMAREYGVKHTFHYDEYETCLHSGLIDAVYIALPNNLHREYAVRAAKAGVHVLCEKPLAVTEDDCQKIIRACAENDVKLMTAYRLHFERGNLEAIDIVHSGQIGEPRIFNSVFTMQVARHNIRTHDRYAGGTLYDIGIYCINAARYLFADEPVEGTCFTASRNDPRFQEIEEMASAVLRFPKNRIASFTASFGAEDTAGYEVIGTKGRLRAIQAYDYSEPVVLELTSENKTRRKTYGLRDQFGPEVIYFSDCILNDREPEPSGIEGLRDVHIIRSLYESAHHGVAVRFQQIQRQHHPSLRQEIYRPRRIADPKLVHVQSPAV